MAEIKNSFLGAKMNKDIDDRLLSKNEYRDAVNVQISKSERSDVGALQTTLGNELLVDFNSFLGLEPDTVQCIGNLVDTQKNRVFLFFTDYNDLTNINTYNNIAKNYICVYNVNENTTQLLVQGSFLNFSISNPIIGINLIEDLLFWTDNRNQPRKINVLKAINSSTYYFNEDQISVAKVNPVYPIELFDESVESPGEYETTMKDVTSELLPNGDTNPYYNEDYIGDPSYLEDKFVRFSYRFKFEDNEYSIIAPFTQIAFIPKQDGYFLYEENPTPGLEPLVDDETATFRSTVVSFMYNKVNNIVLKILLPCNAADLNSYFKITEIEILYKESNALAVQVIDSIPVSEVVVNSIGDVYSYNYQSKKPFKVLPERDIIRVYDKTPVKALGQEIISNRVVYANYQDKQSYPKYLSYNVGFKDKSSFDLLTNKTSIIEYPNHTLKQNRNYQVGIVLCDRFGRQSGVILSDAFSTEDNTFGASSLYVPYKPAGDTINSWPGYALNILFNNPIDGGGVDGWPGLYNGDSTSIDYNPLGWYSYKIVVKQTEQDYYNVYLPGLMAAYPTDADKELDKTSHVVLIGDNINKVPRDLTSISASQEQYRSSVRLYSRINNVDQVWGSQQYYPGNTFSFVNTIATSGSLFSITTVPPDSATSGYNQFYQIESNPLIGRITTVDKLGITYLEGSGASYNETKTIRLAVLETEPFDSRLDIYWETSTVGIIEELNIAIAEESDSVAYLNDWSFSLNESAPIGTTVANDFYFADIDNNIVDVDEAFITFEVKDNLNNDITSYFSLQANGGGLFSVVTADYFYYGYDASSKNPFTFKFTVLSGTPPVTTVFTRTGSLINIEPTIDAVSILTYRPVPEAAGVLGTFTGVNGSNVLGGVDTNDLNWSIISQEVELYPGAGFSPGPSYYSIGPVSGILTRSTDVNFPEHWLITVRLTDAGGLFDEHALELFYYN